MASIRPQLNFEVLPDALAAVTTVQVIGYVEVPVKEDVGLQIWSDRRVPSTMKAQSANILQSSLL